ncbi:isochorismatase family protein [Bacillus sonorensis]|uniref:isochorismatase family protein n=1 Tax=Bacillus sonorensis TaxID=119858 RepID=UPI001F4215AF|nr:isochorismatase family protein [Bacillus sonorensis]MCF7616121.1 isochorismatase family protein [Bacillus sonorensis]MCY7857952.1 isochorismatase family protein [Bacillus sonorensis]MCY8033310.1 isochorismatase family protein [Bacillus sonorensis]MCY8089079.1 isochorismatase family protein [Bacillus sonorensis]MCY8269940.1 isochorismatase family protein [Bacillus sonorensis]
MNGLHIDFNKTALVLIDLQKGIVKIPGGDAVVKKAVKLIDVFRQKQGFICFVNVAFHDGKDALVPETDEPAQTSAERPSDWAEFVPRLGVGEGDYIVTKRQWGAFFGTDLDLQLRRRGIDTIVLCGIATNIGVESTAREAYQLEYQQVFITDAVTTFSEEEHEASIRFIFPRIGRLRTAEEFLSQFS